MSGHQNCVLPLCWLPAASVASVCSISASGHFPQMHSIGTGSTSFTPPSWSGYDSQHNIYLTSRVWGWNWTNLKWPSQGNWRNQWFNDGGGLKPLASKKEVFLKSPCHHQSLSQCNNDWSSFIFLNAQCWLCCIGPVVVFYTVQEKTMAMPLGTFALRLYKSCNQWLLITAHSPGQHKWPGSGPCPNSNCSKIVEVREHWLHSNIKALMSVHWRAQWNTKSWWPRGSREFQHPTEIKTM